MHLNMMFLLTDMNEKLIFELTFLLLSEKYKYIKIKSNAVLYTAINSSLNKQLK